MRGRLQILNSDTCVQPNFSPLEWTSDHYIGKGCSSKFETSTATIRKFSKSKISVQWVMPFSIIFLGLSLLSFSQGVSFILTWTRGIYEWEWSLVICKHLWSLSVWSQCFPGFTRCHSTALRSPQSAVLWPWRIPSAQPPSYCARDLYWLCV